FSALFGFSDKLVSTGFSRVANFLPRAAVRGCGAGPEVAPGVRGAKSPPRTSTAAGRIGTRGALVLSFCDVNATAVDGAIGLPWLSGSPAISLGTSAAARAVQS